MPWELEEDTAHPQQQNQMTQRAISPPVAAGTKDPDIVGRAKAALTDPSEAGRLWPRGPRIGPQIFQPVGDALRGAAQFMLPNSLEAAATQAAMSAVPGGGLGAAGLRLGGATAAPAAVAALKGKDPIEAATKGLAEGVLGEGAGKVLQTGLRAGQAAASRDLFHMQGAIKKITDMIPAFAGKTPQETVARLVGGDAKAALSQHYDDALGALMKQHGDPVLVSPAMEALTGKTEQAIRPASELLSKIQSLQRGMFTMNKQLKNTQDALSRQQLIDAAREEVMTGLKANWGPEGVGALKTLDGQYRKGMELIRLFGAGKEQMTPTQIKKMVPAEGSINMPELQANFARQAGKLRAAMSPEEFTALAQAIRRGEPNALARDIPGKMPGLSWWGPIPHMHGLPRAPVRIGVPEHIAALGGSIGRRVATPGAQRLLED